MNHDQIVTEILARATRRGILSHYCKDTRRCEGHRGLPDVLLVGMFGAAFVEVKTPGDRLDPSQTTWKHALRAAGQAYYVVGGVDLLAHRTSAGSVDWILDALAEGSVAA